MSVSENPYIEFREIPNPNRPTRRISVWSKHIDIELGQIKWYGAWHQYTFHPEVATVWNKGCLESINAKMDEMMKERS